MTPQMTEEQIQKLTVAIETVAKLPKVHIELVGAWVWVSGETKPVKETLKEAGFKWASKKHQWYFPGVPSSGRGRKSIQELRMKYGSTVISENE